MKPGLYIVATPIGNLADITLRALEVLAAVDLVAAEDTRRTRALLAHHGIAQSLLAVHEHNEQAAAGQLVSRMLEGERIALVSDAGTPLLSDPGFRLVCAAIEANVDVFSIPGASAVTAALSIAGLATDRFSFEGFLPSKRAARMAALKALAAEPRTLVFFESSHRIAASVEDMAEALGSSRKAVICRELTKRFETVIRGSLDDILQQLRADRNQSKGEFVVLIEAADHPAAESLVQALKLAELLKDHLPDSKAAAIAAKIHGATRREVYEALLHGPE